MKDDVNDWYPYKPLHNRLRENVSQCTEAFHSISSTNTFNLHLFSVYQTQLAWISMDGVHYDMDWLWPAGGDCCAFTAICFNYDLWIIIAATLLQDWLILIYGWLFMHLWCKPNWFQCTDGDNIILSTIRIDSDLRMANTSFFLKSIFIQTYKLSPHHYFDASLNDYTYEWWPHWFFSDGHNYINIWIVTKSRFRCGPDILIYKLLPNNLYPISIN